MGKIIQIENTSANIALALREQLKRQRICITDAFDTPLGKLFVSEWAWRGAEVRRGAATTKTVLRREPFNSDAIDEQLPANKVQYTQFVEVSLSTEAQLLGWRSGLLPVTQKLPLILVFDLRVTTSPNEVFLIIDFVGIEGLPDLPALQSLKTRVANLFPLEKIPLDLGALSGLGGNPVVANAGIAGGTETPLEDPAAIPFTGSASSFLTDMSVVAVRIELGPYPTSTAAWATFYSSPQQASFATGGRNRPVPPNLPWFVFLDQYFMTERIRQSAEEGFQSSGKFKLQGGMDAPWSAPEGRPIVTLDFYGTAVDACDLGELGSSNIDLHVNAPIEMSVIEPPSPLTPPPPTFVQGILQQNVKVNYWKSDWDTALCLLSAVNVWPYLGYKLMEEDKIDWYEYLGGLLSKSLLTIFALKFINKGGLAPSLGPTCNRPDPDKDEFVCTQPFDTGILPTAGLPQLTDLMGRPDGLVLIGRMFWMERLARRFQLISIDVNPFDLDVPKFSCAAAGAAGLAVINSNPSGFVAYEATVYLNFDVNPLSPDNPTQQIGFSKTARIPPYVCEARVRPEDDVLGVFAPYVSVDDSSPFLAYVHVRVPVDSVPAAYFANPYPCRLLIHTSSGTRMVDIPAMQQAADEDVKPMVLEAWARRVSECKLKARAYDPRWSIDPPDLYRGRHFWDVMVAGLSAGEQVRLQDRQGNIVSAIRANSRGMARLQTLRWPDSYDGQLSFRREAEPAEAASQDQQSEADLSLTAEDIRIDVKQTQFLLRGEIEARNPVRGLAPVMLGDSQGLAVADTEGIAVYDLTLADQPTLMTLSALPGLAGVVSAGARLLAWGEHGVFSLTVDRELGEVDITRLTEGPILGMAAAGGQVFVLRPNRLDVWDRSLQHAASVEVPGARSLVATSNLLLVGTDSTVSIYKVSNKEGPQLAGELSFEGLSRIAAWPFADQDHQFLLQGSKGSTLVDLSEPQRITTVAEYEGVPELARVARHRDLLVELDDDSRSVRIYSIGATALL